MELFVILREDEVVEHHKHDAKQRRIRALRMRAHEARAVAGQMQRASAQATMFRIASTYDRTADLLEHAPDLPLEGLRSAS